MVESVVDAYDSAAVRVDVVESRYRYQGETIAGRFLVSQTWVSVDGTPPRYARAPIVRQRRRTPPLTVSCARAVRGPQG